jgi:hypothetical protein
MYLTVLFEMLSTPPQLLMHRVAFYVLVKIDANLAEHQSFDGAEAFP